MDCSQLILSCDFFTSVYVTFMWFLPCLKSMTDRLLHVINQCFYPFSYCLAATPRIEIREVRKAKLGGTDSIFCFHPHVSIHACMWMGCWTIINCTYFICSYIYTSVYWAPRSGVMNIKSALNFLVFRRQLKEIQVHLRRGGHGWFMVVNSILIYNATRTIFLQLTV